MTADEDQSLQLPPAVGVSSILRRIKGGLNRLGLIRIEGEIHSIKPYPSGHVYLDLKDNEDEAILHCVIWRRNAYRMERLPNQGDAVVLTGTLDVFEVRGQLQFNVVAVQAAGDGALLPNSKRSNASFWPKVSLTLRLKRIAALSADGWRSHKYRNGGASGCSQNPGQSRSLGSLCHLSRGGSGGVVRIGASLRTSKGPRKERS